MESSKLPTGNLPTPCAHPHALRTKRQPALACLWLGFLLSTTQRSGWIPAKVVHQTRLKASAGCNALPTPWPLFQRSSVVLAVCHTLLSDSHQSERLGRQTGAGHMRYRRADGAAANPQPSPKALRLPQTSPNPAIHSARGAYAQRPVHRPEKG